jgi:transposase
MSEYAGKQFVGIDLHRRRSVVVRTTESGEVLESVRILNDVESLERVIARGGEDPEVVLEATYGWYWAADALQAAGASVHLAHPLGVKAFEYRRVKNDFRDAADLADLRRMGRLPEAWIAPPATRELRELVRHRAKLVALRSHCKAEVHAVLAKCGIQVLMSDLFGVEGTALLDRLRLPAPYAARIASLRRLLEDLEFEIDLFTNLVQGQVRTDPGYMALQQIPGIGPVLGAVFLAEVGNVSRFATAPQLACGAGLTPKHHESDTHVHRGRITKQGSRLVRWAAVESVHWSAPAAASAPCATGSRHGGEPTSARSPRPGCRWSTSTTRCVTVTSAHCSTHPGRQHERPPQVPGRSRGRAGHDPRPRRGRAV